MSKFLFHHIRWLLPNLHTSPLLYIVPQHSRQRRQQQQHRNKIALAFIPSSRFFHHPCHPACVFGNQIAERKCHKFVDGGGAMLGAKVLCCRA